MAKKGVLIGCILCVLLGGGLYFGLYRHSMKRPPVPKPPQNEDGQEPAQNEDGQKNPTLSLFADFYQEADERMDTMTLEEKVGQLFLLRCPSDDPLDVIRRLQPAGFVLFANDFESKTKEEVISRIAGFQNASKIPMLMSVDEEGGTVVRISRNPLLTEQKFKSPQALYQEGGLDAIATDTKEKSVLLKSLGLNVNLAPVADVSTDKGDYINARAFGRPAGETADYVTCVVSAMKKAGLSCTLKHFPGYGNNVDTHTGIAYDTRPYQTFEQSDFLPFEAGIKAGAQSVLVSHNIVDCMDSALPASLSPAVHRILRETLRFTGVIMTDDLSMDAIKQYTQGADPCLQAFIAGNDLLLVDDMEEGYQNILVAAQNGEITEEQINASIHRILAWKLSMGMMAGE